MSLEFYGPAPLLYSGGSSLPCLSQSMPGSVNSRLSKTFGWTISLDENANT